MSLCRVKRLRNIWKICEQCLRKHGVKLRSSSYSLFQREVRYLDRIVNQAGHSIDPESTKAVTSLRKSVPNTVGEVRKLTGVLSYYRKYIWNFAKIAKPLYDLLKEPEKKGKSPQRNQRETQNRSEIWDKYHLGSQSVGPVNSKPR